MIPPEMLPLREMTEREGREALPKAGVGFSGRVVRGQRQMTGSDSATDGSDRGSGR